MAGTGCNRSCLDFLFLLSLAEGRIKTKEKVKKMKKICCFSCSFLLA